MNVVYRPLSFGLLVLKNCLGSRGHAQKEVSKEILTVKNRGADRCVNLFDFKYIPVVLHHKKKPKNLRLLYRIIFIQLLFLLIQQLLHPCLISCHGLFKNLLFQLFCCHGYPLFLSM